MYKIYTLKKWLLLTLVLCLHVASFCQPGQDASSANETKYDFGKNEIARDYEPGLNTKYSVIKNNKGESSVFIRFKNSTQKLAIVVITIYPKEGAASNREIQVNPNIMKAENLGHLSMFSVSLKFIDPSEATNPTRINGGAMVENIRLENGKLDAIGFKKDEKPLETKKQIVKVNPDKITGANTIRTFEFFFGKNCCAGMLLNDEDKAIAVRIMKEFLESSCSNSAQPAKVADFDNFLKEMVTSLLQNYFQDCEALPTIGQYDIKEKNKVTDKWKDLFADRKKQGAW